VRGRPDSAGGGGGVWVYCAYNNGSHGYVYGPMADNSRNAYSARFCTNGRRYSSGIQRF